MAEKYMLETMNNLLKLNIAYSLHKVVVSD